MAQSDGNAEVRGLGGWGLGKFSKYGLAGLRILTILGQILALYSVHILGSTLEDSESEGIR
jgi:hypothetical protein